MLRVLHLLGSLGRGGAQSFYKQDLKVGYYIIFKSVW